MANGGQAGSAESFAGGADTWAGGAGAALSVRCRVLVALVWRRRGMVCEAGCGGGGGGGYSGGGGGARTTEMSGVAAARS